MIPPSPPIIVGVAVAALFLLCISGGGKQIAKITSVMVPAMGVLYLIVTVYVVVTHITLVPAVFAGIFRNAL